MRDATKPPKEGDVMKCRYCHDGRGMIFRDGTWEWNAPEVKRISLPTR
jgi:hypothetical protein